MPLAKPVAIAIALLALAITPAAHAASSRAEYVREADQICAGAQPPTFNAYFSYAKAVAMKLSDVKREKLARHPGRIVKVVPGPTLKFAARLIRIYKNETARLATLLAAPGDEGIVAAWLAQRGGAAEIATQSRMRLKQERFGSSNRLFNRATSMSDAAGDSVSAFGFTYCQLALGDAIGFTAHG
jgi:hypothetical protein